MTGRRIAVVGSGVSGLGTAWLLRRTHDVTLFEKEARIGGHCHTVDVPGPDGPTPVDTGFVVYNTRNYPNLVGLLDHLGVGSRESDMSFAVSVDGGRIEYSGSSLGGLFAQRRHLASPRFTGMLADIVRFNRAARRLARQATAGAPEVAFGSLGDFLLRGEYGAAFRDHYLLPMAAAIWSCPPRTMLEFPVQSFSRFFDNHGLLDLWGRPRWRTVEGGSRSYVERLTGDLPGRVVSGDPVVGVRRQRSGVQVTLASGAARDFDQVVLACHADEALALIARPTQVEAALLDAFRYQENRAVLHTDPRLMPRRPRVWSSWNYLARGGGAGDADRCGAVSVTYWMNRLQGFASPEAVFVSLNPVIAPRPEHVIAEMTYHHPVFDEHAALAQRHLGDMQGHDRLWFAGSYTGYGFHEDGLASAVAVAEALGARPPWSRPSPRLRPAAAPAILPGAVPQ